MIEKTIIYGFLIALGMGLGALAIFVWAVLSGQMDETEDVKYRVLEREMEKDREQGPEVRNSCLIQQVTKEVNP